MGLGPAEIGEHAVAHELGDMALEARHLAGHRVLVGADDLPHLLGIEPRRQRGRADQIDEHHRELPALGVARSRRPQTTRLGPIPRRPLVQSRYSLEQPPAVAQVETKLPQIGIGQIAQDVARDAVLGERLSMMAEPLLGEPARDVEHFAPQAIARRERSTPGLAAAAVSRREVWAPERNRRRTPLHAVRAWLTRRFRSLSATQKASQKQTISAT